MVMKTAGGELPRVDVDYDTLEGYLKVLAYANRLQLLSMLRKPRTLDEIRLTPSGPQAGENPERPITRQAVQNHLDRLIEAGMVRVEKTTRHTKRPVQQYVLDQARVFSVSEEFRKLGLLEPVTRSDPFMTQDLGAAPAAEWDTGPKLVLVHGVGEGKAFPLRTKETKSPRGWVIGRGRGVHVSLEFDPYVSAENAEVLPDGTGHRLLDLRTSRNGTYLNWRRLEVGGEAGLEPGDVIGVGRSLLVYRAR